MKVVLRSDGQPDVGVEEYPLKYMQEAQLEQHIRTLQAALAWLRRENRLKEQVSK